MKEFAIICGSPQSPVQKTAVEQLSEFLLDYTRKYPVCMAYDSTVDFSGFRCIYIGTKQSNGYIREHSRARLDSPEAYAIEVRDGVVMIEGYDDRGVLYGCVDFYNKYLLKIEFTTDATLIFPNPVEKPLPDFALVSAPAIRNRGIWTWGHVIYDYRSFLRNMAKLKMNTLIVWNDFVPCNAGDIIAFAHGCGIRILLGYSWCWDTDCTRFSLDAINKSSPEFFETYEKQYSGLDIDGIYFQSFTEVGTDSINGTLVAPAVTEFVNRTVRPFLEKYPNLELQFGLHATSVRNKLAYIKNVDPRIRIVWEDCGAFPFSYLPGDTEDYSGTLEFAGKISVLRGADDKFGVVTKGLTKLDWTVFEHMQGPACIGVSSRRWRESRSAEKNRLWKYLQAYWLTNSDKAYGMIQYLRAQKRGNLDVTALVEDGMFEEKIMFPVALYSEMLWDCGRELPEMINEVALRDYVAFA